MTLNQTQVRARELAQRQIDRGRMSVKLLSARTGVKESHCSNWLHGNRGASVGFLSRVLDALEVQIELLPKRANDPTTPFSLVKP